MRDDLYFYLRDGVEHGAFSEIGISSLAKSGELEGALVRTARDPVWRDPSEIRAAAPAQIERDTSVAVQAPNQPPESIAIRLIKGGAIVFGIIGSILWLQDHLSREAKSSAEASASTGVASASSDKTGEAFLQGTIEELNTRDWTLHGIYPNDDNNIRVRVTNSDGKLVLETDEYGSWKPWPVLSMNAGSHQRFLKALSAPEVVHDDGLDCLAWSTTEHPQEMITDNHELSTQVRLCSSAKNRISTSQVFIASEALKSITAGGKVPSINAAPIHLSAGRLFLQVITLDDMGGFNIRVPLFETERAVSTPSVKTGTVKVEPNAADLSSRTSQSDVSAAFDPKNATYPNDGLGDASPQYTLKDGVHSFGEYESDKIKLDTVATGDISGDGIPETVVDTSWHSAASASGRNYYLYSAKLSPIPQLIQIEGDFWIRSGYLITESHDEEIVGESESSVGSCAVDHVTMSYYSIVDQKLIEATDKRAKRDQPCRESSG